MATRQATTATLACMIVVATWVLAVVARPYEAWKVALVLVSGLAYVVIFTWPFTQSLFLLDIGDAAAMRLGLILGLIGAVLIEAMWWVRGLVFGESLVLWKKQVAD